jgi:hypothetical protein
VDPYPVAVLYPTNENLNNAMTLHINGSTLEQAQSSRKITLENQNWYVNQDGVTFGYNGVFAPSHIIVVPTDQRTTMVMVSRQSV